MDKELSPSLESSPNRWVTIRRPPTAMTKPSRKRSAQAESSHSQRRPSNAEPHLSGGFTGGSWWSDDGPPDSPLTLRPTPISITPWRYGNLCNPDRSGPPPTQLRNNHPSPSLPSPPPANAPLVSPPPAIVRGPPQNWPDRLPWWLPFYPTTEEWAQAERETKMMFRELGLEVSSSSKED